jgi:hypothetical protein
MAQLKRGGKQTLEAFRNKLDYIDHYTADNPAAVRKLTQQLRDMLEEEIKPHLIRAAPDLEQRIKELEEWRASIEQPNVTRLRKAE